MLRYLLLTAFIFPLVSCSFFNRTPEQVRKAEPGLSMEYAKLRSENISEVKYALNFDLTQSEKFSGAVQINFQMKKKIPLTVDFSQGEVQRLKINGKTVAQVKYNQFFIDIPRANLNKGANEILVEFTHAYSKDGSGLYRFIDPVDKTVYTNTDFEPYDANLMFPCFDQPDLKANYTTSVTTPKNWEVITSVYEESKKVVGQTIEWTFPQSQKFSTYVYALHAGEYMKWESEVRTPAHLIPLRLFARKSLAKFIQLEDWFVPTQQGFVFFEDYFGYPYPYIKYDQVLVPDFNFGAMENVAAVTFNEDRFIHRGQKTRANRRSLAHTILHEMAHMWFGDLVTMKWWNDLWLNESFATYMSTKALAEATEFKEAWMSFNNRNKASAYWSDQLATTHPIEAKISNTDEAFANFDGITYGKGASVLKQMAFYVGDENFQSALTSYFQRHAHGNTVLADFMEVMTLASGKDMKNWQSKWLQTAMVNNVSVEYKCQANKISEFHIIQTATAEYPTIRPHSTQVALVTKNGNSYRVSDSFTVNYEKEKTVVAKAMGKVCPEIVYPNYQDHDFAKVALDEKSLVHIKEGLLTMDDSFLRAMIWTDLWEMLRDQKIDVLSFLDIVKVQGLDEPELTTLHYILERAQSALAIYIPREGRWGQKRFEWVKKFEQAYLQKLKSLKGNPHRQRVWFDYYVGLVESQRGLDELAGFLKAGEASYLSIKFDQDRRWAMLTKLSQYQHKEAKTLLEKEKKFDTSKKGLQRALVAEAIEPNLEVKKAYFQRVAKGPAADSFGELRAIMGGLFPSSQKKLHKEFNDLFFSKLKDFGLKQDPSFVASFASNLVPTFCEPKSSEEIKGFISKNRGLPKTARVKLKNAAQENSRCFAIQEKLKSSLSL